MARLLDLGVDGIMTDETETLRDVLVARGQWHPQARQIAGGQPISAILLGTVRLESPAGGNLVRELTVVIRDG